MAEKATKNIYQKLMQARIDFSKKKIDPSGYNRHLDFDYLELKDIVPVANKVFQDNGLMLITTFDDGFATGAVVDTDNPEGPSVLFRIAYRQSDADSRLKSNSPIQICGQNVTYLRRYLYQLALDIVVTDEVDIDTDDTPVVKPAVVATPKVKTTPKEEKKTTAKVVVSSPKKAPATPAERQEIKKELTGSDGPADDLQIKTLNALIMRWVNTVPADKETATAIMVQTNSFTKCTRKDAEELINVINKKIADAEKKE